MKKKIFSIVLLVVLLLGSLIMLTGCGESGDEEDKEILERNKGRMDRLLGVWWIQWFKKAPEQFQQAFYHV